MQTFMGKKGKPVTEFSDEKWKWELVDITTHWNKLTSWLQGQDQLINVVWSGQGLFKNEITSFERYRLKTRILCILHFFWSVMFEIL